MPSFEHAVVVMGKLPVPGLVKTRLQLAPDVAAKLYRAFLADVFDHVEAALEARPGRAVFACALGGGALSAARALAPRRFDVVPQIGDGLGARMLEAWRAGGARQTVVMGSDVPTLASDRIVEVLDALAVDHPRAAFIPALDGGYPLFGLNAELAPLFEEMEWSTPTVLQETLRRAEAQGIEALTFAAVGDVDEPADLERLRTELEPGSHTFRALIGLGLESSPVHGVGDAGLLASD